MYIHLKRIMDFSVSSLALLILSPLMLIVSLLIKFQNDGPVLFKQERPGKNGKIFTVYKFRTMSTTLEKDGKVLSDMQRMTKLGKFLRATSLDELPQLINIFKGEMSFIGPRPLLKEYLSAYTPEQMKRHNVTPGISGWAQVNGRNAISWEQKFDYDVYYVNNISFLLDIKIFFLTIINVVKREGINCNNENTMEKFHGSVNDEIHTKEALIK